MKTLIIYHANCMDGFGAAWAAYTGILPAKHADDEIILYPATYGDPAPADLIDENTEVFILDFSYPKNVILELAAEADSVTVLDHHKTAREALESLSEIYIPNLAVKFDMNKSGAMLAWEFFHAHETAPLLIQHIQDRDLWKFEIDGTKEFHLMLTTVPKDITVWSELNNRIMTSPDYYSKFLEAGTAIQCYYDQQVQDIISATKRPITINGIAGLCCSCNHMFASDVGNILAKESGTYGASMFQDSKGDVKFSLRSIGDYDVSAIAKSFGGGGHKNAAGFTLASPRELEDGLVTIWSEQAMKADAEAMKHLDTVYGLGVTKNDN